MFEEPRKRHCVARVQRWTGEVKDEPGGGQGPDRAGHCSPLTIFYRILKAAGPDSKLQ